MSRHNITPPPSPSLLRKHNNCGACRGMEDDAGDQFVGYFTPTMETVKKREAERKGLEPQEVDYV